MQGNDKIIEAVMTMLEKNPEFVVTMVNTYIEKYKPAVYGTLKELSKLRDDFAENKDWFKTTAKIKKQMFDAYVEVGFTEDQAVAFILNDNLQLMKNLKDSMQNASKSAKN